jgi:hypothetical protein
MNEGMKEWMCSIHAMILTVQEKLIPVSIALSTIITNCTGLGSRLIFAVKSRRLITWFMTSDPYFTEFAKIIWSRWRINLMNEWMCSIHAIILTVQHRSTHRKTYPRVDRFVHRNYYLYWPGIASDLRGDRLATSYVIPDFRSLFYRSYYDNILAAPGTSTIMLTL